MNNFFYKLFAVAILFVFVSCTSVPTDPPPEVEPPKPEIFTLNFDFSIESASTNNYDAGITPPNPDGDGGNIPPEPPISPVVVRFGDVLYPIEKLYEGLEFTNNSEVELTVSVNNGYNVFIGGAVGPEIKPVTASLTFQITNNTGIIIHVTNTQIEFREITLKKFGRGALFVSGNKITDTETHKLSFPRGYFAKMRFEFPEENGIIYSYSIDNNPTIHYPALDTIVTNISMDNNISYLFRFGRRNDPWDGVSANEAIFDNNTYEIYNSYELAWVASQANLGSNNFNGNIVKLINDLDLNSIPFDGIARKKFFAGTFDGNNKVVDNIKIIPVAGSSANAFIGQLNNGGSISKLTIKGSIEGTNESVGGIVGIVGDGTFVSYVTNYARVVGAKGTSVTGGVIGNVLTGSKVSYLANYGPVSGSRNVGGIAGRTLASIEYAHNGTNVFGDSFVGGIVGSNGGGGILFCYNTGYIEGTKNYVGGVAGYNYNASVSVGYNTGVVKGHDYVGGLEGYRNTDVSLASTYNIANVIGATGSVYVGALTGFSAVTTDGVLKKTVENSYALKTDTVNKNLPLYYGHGTADYKDIFTEFKDADQFDTTGFLTPNSWTLETFTGDRLINNVSKRFVIVGLEEKDSFSR